MPGVEKFPLVEKVSRCKIKDVWQNWKQSQNARKLMLTQAIAKSAQLVIVCMMEQVSMIILQEIRSS